MVEAEKAGHEKLPKTTDLDRSGERLTTRKNPAANQVRPCIGRHAREVGVECRKWSVAVISMSNLLIRIAESLLEVRYV